MAIACRGKESVVAELKVNPERQGWFVLKITNVSSNILRFLDVREGTAACGNFYEIIIENNDSKKESKGGCFYAPIGIPKLVEIRPGKTYSRDIQPAAYVLSAEHIKPPYSIIVAYRVTEEAKKRWKDVAKEADLKLRFKTERITIEPSNKQVEATRQ